MLILLLQGLTRIDIYSYYIDFSVKISNIESRSYLTFPREMVEFVVVTTGSMVLENTVFVTILRFILCVHI